MLFDAPTPSPLREDAHGVVRVGQTRVTLQSVVGLFDDGASAEEIALRYDTLALGDVYATLSFYIAHREQVTVYLNAQKLESERARSAAEERSPLADLRRRLLVRRSA